MATLSGMADTGVTCWRCGNQRLAGPAWCGTCGATERPPVGFHQTFRGPLTVTPPPKPPPTVEEKRRTRRRNRLLAGLAVVAAVGMGTCVALASRDSSSTAGTLSASACSNVVEAGQQAADGSRSMGSFLATARREEPRARQASDMNSRYLPITQAIVAVRADLENGYTPTALRTLINECG